MMANQGVPMPAGQSGGPIFITGSPRSGTSIFILGLKDATGIAGFGEGQLLDIYSKLQLGVDRHYTHYASSAADPRHAIGNITADQVKQALARTLLDLSNQVHGGTAWIDKTGGTEMMDYLSMLTRLGQPFFTFFCYRRPIENVFSRLKKFPKFDITYHAQDWVKIMQAWRATRALLPAGSWLEVEQKDIADKPELVAAEVAKVLNLADEQRDRMVGVFQKQRPQVLASDAVGRTLTINQTGWDLNQRTAFRLAVDAEMRVWGFTYDERYRVPVASAAQAAG